MTEAPRTRAPRVLVFDADSALVALLDEWLADLGCSVVHAAAAGDGEGGPADLVIVDLPFPRQAGVDWVRRISSRHPTTPVLALSSSFFSGIECNGPAARSLGVACVLAKPASREALSAAVRRLLT